MQILHFQEIHREPVEGTPGGSGGVKGMTTQEAERQFLKIACQLDTYGIDPHPVKVSAHFPFFFNDNYK